MRRRSFRQFALVLIVASLVNLMLILFSARATDMSFHLMVNGGQATTTPVPTPLPPVATLTPVPATTQTLDCEIEVRRSSGIEWAVGVPDSYCTAAPGTQLQIYVPQR